MPYMTDRSGRFTLDIPKKDVEMRRSQGWKIKEDANLSGYKSVVIEAEEESGDNGDAKARKSGKVSQRTKDK